MIFTETRLKGAFVIELDKKTDERGYFARTFCEREFADHGLKRHFVQCNTSFNRRKGTLRGMHFQAAPHEEAKLVRCTRGSLFDAIIDLRAGSPTHNAHIAETLSADNGKMLYIPEGFAHGFQTLEDDTEIFYQMTEFYHADAARGVRWNDPAFGIKWPAGERIIIQRDQEYPLVAR